jgi:uncharacterized BrkB/YihY/UPF0761 family membrane protein
MIQFLIGLIVIASIVIVLYLTGRIVAKRIYQEPDPSPEEILLAIILAMTVIVLIACFCALIYLVGEAVMTLVG